MGKKISSNLTFFYKKIFPTIWFGLIALFTVTAFVGGAAEQNVMFLVVPVLMIVFGFVFFKKLLWDLADEVYDHADFLLVRNGDDEERIPLSQIMNVDASMMMNPPRVTLRLLTPGKFGSEVSFSPPMSLNPFTKSPIVQDLISRAYGARPGR